MNVYLFSGIYIAIFSIFDRFITSSLVKKIYRILVMIPTFLISAFHGNISVDYISYRDIFNAVRITPLLQAIQNFNIEPGYLLLNKFVGLFTDDFVGVLFIVTLINLGIFYRLFNKYSDNFALSLLLLISFGSYYVSFNLIRQYLAASILILAVMSIEKGFSRYLMWVLIASTFHSSALLMIIIYPILNLRILKIRDFIFYSIGILMLFLTVIFASNFIGFITQFMYQGYLNSNAFGISIGNELNVLVRPIFVGLYVALLNRNIDQSSLIDRIGINSIFLLFCFLLLSTQIKMIERLSYFFAPYMTVYLPKLNSRFNNIIYQFLMDILLIILCLIFIILTQRNDIFLLP
ncbi:EpsG family protein [Aerococcus sp.]|uniref:EpsG family protein n=1 Tax=Aerococcus sp. TaxID=1872398 RepID=UPI0028AB1286|nr:EpsG family protein [Aerococcus sp.]